MNKDERKNESLIFLDQALLWYYCAILGKNMKKRQKKDAFVG
ncbi:MAG: hypothetical protein ACI4L5_00370 [Negativibacillus sp.]